MGYSTDFYGEFTLNKKLDDNTYKLLKGLSETRRMKRKVDPKYGVEGEFYIDGEGFMGQDHDDTVIDGNSPPSTQPGLWCQWTPTEDRMKIVWDEGEKFYYYVEWIEYLISKILKPRGYILSGQMDYQGEDTEDVGRIIIACNQVDVHRASITYEDVDALKKENGELKDALADYVLLGNNKKIDKIKKLAALATSDNPNEARSAIDKLNGLLNENTTNR